MCNQKEIKNKDKTGKKSLKIHKSADNSPHLISSIAIMILEKHTFLISEFCIHGEFYESI